MHTGYFTEFIEDLKVAFEHSTVQFKCVQLIATFIYIFITTTTAAPELRGVEQLHLLKHVRMLSELQSDTKMNEAFNT